jgi:peptidoglycan hydrolase-like protein with peptidoglycan-binding domain
VTPRRRLRNLAIGVAVLLIGVGLGWAATLVLTPPTDVLDSTKFTYVEVVDGEVGSSITLNSVAEWTPVPAGSNLAAGTVTTINVEPGQEVAPGATLYSVNLRPVVVAQGEIPAFQALAAGVRGADVAQLQGMLSSLGYFSSEANGIFGKSTTLAVKAWQKSLGVSATGVVEPGDIVFVPTLPTRVALDLDVVRRGAVLAGGEPVVLGLPDAPEFSVPVSDSQAALMPAGTRVEITSPNGSIWDAFVVDSEADDRGSISMRLRGEEGTSICGEDCTAVPVIGQTLLLSRVVTVESVTGPTVPSAALLSGANGTLWVIDSTGTRHEVTVETSARGISVIDGVSAGMRVRVPAVED